MRSTNILFSSAALFLTTLTAVACQRGAPSSSTTATTDNTVAVTTASASASTLSASVAAPAAVPDPDGFNAVARILAAQGRDPACSSLISAGDKKHIEVEVREKHGGKCGGDPATSPIMGRYRVGPSGDVTVCAHNCIAVGWRCVM